MNHRGMNFEEDDIKTALDNFEDMVFERILMKQKENPDLLKFDLTMKRDNSVLSKMLFTDIDLKDAVVLEYIIGKYDLSELSVYRIYLWVFLEWGIYKFDELRGLISQRINLEELKKEVEKYKSSGDVNEFNKFLDYLDLAENPDCHKFLLDNLTSEEVGRLI